jgi:hypothetical protein
VARYAGLAAAGESIIRFLKGAFVDFPSGVPGIEQVTTATLSGSNVGSALNATAGNLTLLLYRVDIDAQQRNPITSSLGSSGLPERRFALPLTLRYLLTAWASQPDVQQLILGRALSVIAGHPSFGPSDLVTTLGGVAGVWSPEETFQLVPDEIGTEDLYQIWQALGRSYELSVPLKARVIHLEAERVDGAGTVLERDLVYGKAVPDPKVVLP